MGSKEIFEWFEQVDELLAESDVAIEGTKRFLEQSEQDNQGEKDDQNGIRN